MGPLWRGWGTETPIEGLGDWDPHRWGGGDGDPHRGVGTPIEKVERVCRPPEGDQRGGTPMEEVDMETPIGGLGPSLRGWGVTETPIGGVEPHGGGWGGWRPPEGG